MNQAKDRSYLHSNAIKVDTSTLSVNPNFRSLNSNPINNSMKGIRNSGNNNLAFKQKNNMVTIHDQTKQGNQR